MSRIFAAIAAPFHALMTPDGRRGWALLFMAGGAIGMTTYATAALWFVRKNPAYAFSLGAGALVIIALVLTGFVGLLVKRSVKATDGKRVLEISDTGGDTSIASPAEPS